jgi:hypothetical protein
MAREWQWKWPFREVPQLALRVGYTGPVEPGVAERRGGRYPEVLDLRGGGSREVHLPGQLRPTEAA